MVYQLVARDMLMTYAGMIITRNKIWMSQVDWGMWFYKRKNLQSYKHWNDIERYITNIEILFLICWYTIYI